MKPITTVQLDGHQATGVVSGLTWAEMGSGSLEDAQGLASLGFRKSYTYQQIRQMFARGTDLYSVGIGGPADPFREVDVWYAAIMACLLYTSPSPRD